MAEARQIQDEMPKAYEPANTEQKWYRFWTERSYFTPEIDPEKKPFVIIMPLPNVTGELHIGHVLYVTLQDIMTRWHRMMGEPALWLPGVDHAGIATQVVVERQLAAEGTDRYQLGREKLLERIYRWTERCRKIITEQHSRLGASCDWSREYFTLDEGPSLAVRTVFVNLYNKGLIYRGERIINWCPRCATALSDLEVEHKDMQGSLWYVRYPFADGDGFITVATTRPETILGDTAVAVNPGDERFKSVIGKKVILPAVNREVEIIADDAVDLEFGTGAVKITPAHDPVDFEVAQRHGLEFINILNPDATMNENAGPYVGMDRYACREAIVADLEKDGLLEKIEPYANAVGHCLRCQTTIEPLVSEQWFVKIEPLVRPAIDAVRDGRITIIPSHFAKVYLNWMENIRDWCISRQIWWGHRIPVWYCRDCGELTVAVDEPETCGKCKSKNIEQDPDMLDTWFSSALVTHSTLGWPGDTEDLRYFYPTSVMETAYDILPFWVARMIMMGLEDVNDVPFHTVYLHGLVRDDTGDKISKVRGNVLDPIDVLEQYGTDALRYSIIAGTSAGTDSKLSVSKLEAGRNFANKLWNATRFVVRSIDGGQAGMDIKKDSLPVEDRWILSRLNRTVSSVDKLLGDFQFSEAQRQIYEFLWSEYCDWYIELAKIRLNSPDKEVPSPLPVLVYVLETALRLLHPCMPFITEELWQNLKRRLPEGWQPTESIMIASYPEPDSEAIDPEAERIMESMIDVIRSIRNVHAQYKGREFVPGGVTIIRNIQPVEAKIYAGELKIFLAPYNQTIQKLSRARKVTVLDRRQRSEVSENIFTLVLNEVEVEIIPIKEVVDLEAEKRRLEKELERNQAEVDRLESRLQDKAFLEKAPAAVIDKERQKRDTLTDKIERLKQQLLKY